MDVKYKLTSQHQHGSQKDPLQSTHNPLQECKLGNLLSKLFLTVAHICHGKTYLFTAKLTFPRQNLLFHGKTYFSTAKLTFSRQNLLFHGKTYFSTAKLTFPRQNLLFHGKTYFSTAKLTFSRQNLLFHGKTYFFTAKLHKGTWTGSVCKQNQDGDGL